MRSDIYFDKIEKWEETLGIFKDILFKSEGSTLPFINGKLKQNDSKSVLGETFKQT